MVCQMNRRTLLFKNPSLIVHLPAPSIQRSSPVSFASWAIRNAFASQAQAEAWQHAHPEAAVRLLTQEAAIVEARTLFEHLLDEAEALPASPVRQEAS